MMDTKFNKFSKGMVWTLLGVLGFLTVVSATLLAVRLANYISKDDKEVLLQSNFDEQLDLFSIQYENQNGEVVVSGAEGQKVVAPGTSVDYTIRLRNKDKVAIDYELTPEASNLSEYSVPIYVRILDDDGNYVVGDAKTWASIEEVSDVVEKKILLKGESTEYIFQWKWEFESGDDEYDTFLGSIVDKENVGVSVKLNLYAQANTEVGANGGVMKSGLGDIIAAGSTFVLLSGAVTVMIIYLVKRRKLGL